MNDSANKREQDKIREVAREYEKKGFHVLTHPRLGDLPSELRDLNYLPDIVVTSDNLNLIIEVKTYKSIQKNKLDSVIKKINRLKDWQFELVYTNAKETDSRTLDQDGSTDNVRESLARAALFLESDVSVEFSDAGLLLAWSAVENSLRTAYLMHGKRKSNQNTASVIRDSVILGVIGKRQQEYLENLMRKRNELAHGIYRSEVSHQEIRELLDIGYDVYNQIA